MLKLRYDLSIWESAMFSGGDDPALNFDGTSIYGVFTHPWSGVSGDEIHITFNTSTSGINAAQIPVAQFTSSDTLSLTDCTATISGDVVAHGADISSYLDGNDHVMVLTLTAGVTVTYYGQNGSSANYFDGQLPSIKFIDKSGASDVIKAYQINNESTLYVPIAGGSLGSELVVNGGFDTDTGWTKNTGWTIGSGVATSTGAGAAVFQDLTGWAVSGQHYLAGVTAKTLDAGYLDIRIGGGDAQNYGTRLTSAGVSSGIIQWSGVGGSLNVISVNSSFIGTADDATVKALPESILLYGVQDSDWS